MCSLGVSCLLCPRDFFVPLLHAHLQKRSKLVPSMDAPHTHTHSSVRGHVEATSHVLVLSSCHVDTPSGLVHMQMQLAVMITGGAAKGYAR